MIFQFQILARIVKGMFTTWRELVLSQVSGTNNVSIVLIANTLWPIPWTMYLTKMANYIADPVWKNILLMNLQNPQLFLIPKKRFLLEKMRKNVQIVKVSWFQNVLLVSSFGAKYQRKSALEFEMGSNHKIKALFNVFNTLKSP